MNERPKGGPETESAKRILVIDDESGVTEFLIRVLEENGFKAWAVNNPLEALERVKEIRPDLIVLDFDMSQLVGSEVAMVLKSDSETRGIPIVFLSGMTDEDHRQIAASSGAAAYLDKPIDPAKLVETLLTLLSRRIA